MLKKNSAILKITAIILILTIVLKLCLVFLWPFVLSIILIIFVEPLINIFNKAGLKRKMACILSYAFFITSLVLIVFFISNYAYKQIIDFFNYLPKLLEELTNNTKLININNEYKQIITSLQNFLITYRSKIFKTIISTINGFIYLFIILMTSILMSIDLPKIIKESKKILPFEVYIIIEKVINKISNIITAEIKLVFITTFETVIGLYILGINNALTIGIICGILDILPVVGPALIFLPWIVYEIIIKNFVYAIGLILLYVLLQIIRQILEVKFVGTKLKIHPVTTIFSLYIGILIFGIWGVIFGPFMIILTKELYNKYYEGRFRLYL